MNSSQVIDILGKPTQTTETDFGSLGRMELWHFQDTGLSAIASGKIEACDVHFSNGKVESKTWTKL